MKEYLGPHILVKCLNRITPRFLDFVEIDMLPSVADPDRIGALPADHGFELASHLQRKYLPVHERLDLSGDQELRSSMEEDVTPPPARTDFNATYRICYMHNRAIMVFPPVIISDDKHSPHAYCLTKEQAEQLKVEALYLCKSVMREPHSLLHLIMPVIEPGNRIVVRCSTYDSAELIFKDPTLHTGTEKLEPKQDLIFDSASSISSMHRIATHGLSRILRPSKQHLHRSYLDLSADPSSSGYYAVAIINSLISGIIADKAIPSKADIKERVAYIKEIKTPDALLDAVTPVEPPKPDGFWTF
ncbi:MAG: hypothetical protein KBD64_02725 [Gammaproteobacteria bacterium]|nr:hypothetical protein [Gammaproteobacteria bacterium]